MEPRLNSRGNVRHDEDQFFELLASMEPRLNSRGNAFTVRAFRSKPAASMEPRLNSRGNGGATDETAELRALQWSRG